MRVASALDGKRMRRGAGCSRILVAVAAAAAAVALTGTSGAEAFARSPANLTSTAIAGGVTLPWDAHVEEPELASGYQGLWRGDGQDAQTTFVRTTDSPASTFSTSNPGEGGDTYTTPVQATLSSVEPDADQTRADNMVEADSCPIDGGTPVDVTVSDVPIVVTSTTDDYFVLYVLQTVDTDTVELPVLVKLGEAGTTTLADNLAPLTASSYKVEKYPVDNPADVDGDCVDDLTELNDLGKHNPVNPGAAVPEADGTVAIPDRATFEALAYQGEDTYGDVHLKGLEYVKFYILNPTSDHPTVYFMNTVRHRAHGFFALAVGISTENSMRGEIIYHPKIPAPDGTKGLYRFEFQPTDSFSFTYVSLANELLAASMPFLTNNLAYYPMPYHALPLYQTEKALYDASRVEIILDEEFYKYSDYIVLNRGEGYGLLRKMSLDERPHPRDIVIYETLPNDLPLVAGIITGVPQTPLSHVNLRAIQSRAPNAFIRDPLEDDTIDGLLDSHVYYSATTFGYTIRAATKAEVDAHYNASRPATTQTPARDLSVTAITPLSQVSFSDWDAFGVKAANVAVLGTLGFPAGTVPNGFAIPFSFYDRYMKETELGEETVLGKKSGPADEKITLPAETKLSEAVTAMLAHGSFQTDYDIQEEMLDDLRDAIEDATSPQWLIDALTTMHDTYPADQSLRYRSSTNNEDLPGFSGAGLYDSKTQDPDETVEDGIDKSIKGVWASLWNFRAFIEREFNRVDHTATAMGVLVHPNYKDELANGVAVSHDPFTGRSGAYYVNTQVGEDLVTNPDEYSRAEEILLFQDGTHQVRFYSEEAGTGQLIMSQAQMTQLRNSLTTIHNRFKTLYGITGTQQFAMEIEFKITSADILAIKQARPWVFTQFLPSFTSMAGGARTVEENVPAGTAVGDPVSATDENGDTLTYALEGTDAASFSIDAATGQIRTLAALDFETKDSYSVSVTVHDGKGPTGGVSTALDSTVNITITVIDVDEDNPPPPPPPPGIGGGGFGPAPVAPKFSDGFRTTRELPVNAGPNELVGDPVEATHPDDLEITYSIAGADASLFTVGAATGQIRTKDQMTLNVGNTYTFNLTATDSAGFGAIVIVMIEVTEPKHHRYDANRNGAIEHNEVIAAVRDYFKGAIEKRAVIELVKLYFAAPR